MGDVWWVDGGTFALAGTTPMSFVHAAIEHDPGATVVRLDVDDRPDALIPAEVLARSSDDLLSSVTGGEPVRGLVELDDGLALSVFGDPPAVLIATTHTTLMRLDLGTTEQRAVDSMVERAGYAMVYWSRTRYAAGTGFEMLRSELDRTVQGAVSLVLWPWQCLYPDCNWINNVPRKGAVMQCAKDPPPARHNIVY